MDFIDISQESLLKIQGEYVEARSSSVIYKDFRTEPNECKSFTKKGVSLRIIDRNRLKSVHTDKLRSFDEILAHAPWVPIASYSLPSPITGEESPPEPLQLPVGLVTDILKNFSCHVTARLESLTVYEHICTNHGTDIYHGQSTLFVRIFETLMPGLTLVHFFSYPGESIKQKLESLDFHMNTFTDHTSLRPGMYDVVLSPHVTGMIFHEILHSFEGTEPTLKYPSFVSISDNPAAERLGGYAFDAEGCRASRTSLICNGEVTGCLTSILHPGDRNPTGNARSSFFDTEPIPRQSNIEVDINAGGLTEEELFETVGNGIYIDQIGQGSAFPGHITYFENMVSYCIEEGEVRNPVLGVAFGGNLPQVVNTIQYSGRHYETYPTVCWKDNQRLFTTMRAPPVLVRKMPLYISSKS